MTGNQFYNLKNGDVNFSLSIYTQHVTYLNGLCELMAECGKRQMLLRHRKLYRVMTAHALDRHATEKKIINGSSTFVWAVWIFPLNLQFIWPSPPNPSWCGNLPYLCANTRKKSMNPPLPHRSYVLNHYYLPQNSHNLKIYCGFK